MSWWSKLVKKVVAAVEKATTTIDIYMAKHGISSNWGGPLAVVFVVLVAAIGGVLLV